MLKANRLAKESSPYLLQHAHNPVDWYPWGDEAIKKARDEDKPMLVSIGYSACHWCHVMERESFEDPETAAIMNRDFVNIKIDREERPDLDQIYMDAVQAITGAGGWPLNVFLTPEGKPFYGGTYFPPAGVQNRPSWKSVLQYISTIFREKRDEINGQAENLTNHIASSSFGNSLSQGDEDFSKEDVRGIYEQLMKTADIKDGGFGMAPKFPQTFSIRFLLQYYYHTGTKEALDHACLSLNRMIHGGIYDQLAGGFSRYSTDSEWLAPHFEKMLYDNALLVTAMSEAYQVTKNLAYSKAIQETMYFLENELYSEEGAFFSALDADSEGEEGKFYIWLKSEISDILGGEAEAFCNRYDVSEKGNWEHKNILRLTSPGIGLSEEKETEWKKKLMAHRNQRIRPSMDDKILAGWNALVITACCKAFAALGIEKYRSLAVKTMIFLEEKMTGEGIHHFFHSYKKGSAVIPAFLDDYAFIIEAYIQLQEVTGEDQWLIRAKALTDWVIENFGEEENGYFYYTHSAQHDVIIRKREVYDGATPSGNAVMAANLLYLGTVFDLEVWKKRTAMNAAGLKDVIGRYPGSFGVWATLINTLTYKLNEIVLVGPFLEQKHREFLSRWVPNRVFQVSSVSRPEFPLLRNKQVWNLSHFFLCRDYTCQPPVKEVDELINLLKNS